MMKIQDMKKGGYTLFSNKTRKMLLAMGLSILSVYKMNMFSYAEPSIEAKFVKDDLAGKKIYQVELQETEENVTLDLYKQETGNDAVKIDNPLIWQDNDGKILAVVEIADDTSDKLVVKNSANQEASVSLNAFTQDNEEPKLQWAYKNVEENYIQFEARDVTNIYRVVDKNGNDRVKIDEKDQDNVLTAKYVLEPGEKEFYLYDILGNEAKIEIDDIETSYTIAAKNTEGKKVVLNMAIPQTASLMSIETVKGENIATSQNVTKELKGENGDSLVAIYDGVTEGTTYLKVKYEIDGEEKTIKVLLDLDVTAPVIVRYNEEGEVVESGGNARAYKNQSGDKAIVEVKDMVSGITKIVVYEGNQEGSGENQKFEIRDLPTSVVQLVDLTQNSTSIRVYDGIGNVCEIDLTNDVSEDDGSGIDLDMSVDDNEVVTASLIDKKAGLEKFVRISKDSAVDKDVVETYERNYVPESSAYKSLQTKEEIQSYYSVAKEEITLSGDELQGIPEFTAVDVFGNMKEYNMNKILFNVDSIMMATKGQGEDTIVKAVIVKLKDIRRIKKITATINDEEVVLETFETGENVGDGPKELDKAYEMPNNAHVSKMTIYHSNDDNVTQNEIVVDFTSEPGQEESPVIQLPEEGQQEVEPGQEPQEDPAIDIRKDFVEMIPEEDPHENDPSYEPGPDEEPYTAPVVAKIKYGIKKIEYQNADNSKGCIIEFFEDLPKEVEVCRKDRQGNAFKAVIITDALGYTYDVANNQEVDKYNPESN